MPFVTAGSIHRYRVVRPAGFCLARALLEFLSRLAEAIVAAQRLSRERQQLAEMDTAQLKDIGLTEADRIAELCRPVWRR